MSREKIISVFGGSTPREGSPAYADARRLGGWLAEAGFAVATGGYTGTMEAASRGAAEAGGHVIGVTCAHLERHLGRLGANRWVSEEIKYETMRQRLNHLVEKCDASIALPGGIGTLSEVALTWSLLQTGEILRKPFVLVGDGWQAALTTFYRGADGYVPEADWQLLEFAPDVQSAAHRVTQALMEN
ncbi:MAG: LOG family protein [Chloroflexi bacterium]|nr:LOG family protein [Chloroflexota bacterium]